MSFALNLRNYVYGHSRSLIDRQYWAAVAKHTALFSAAVVYTIKFPGPSVYAKQARGLFCRFMCERAVKRPNQLAGARFD